jgi:hypothetical protein
MEKDNFWLKISSSTQKKNIFLSKRGTSSMSHPDISDLESSE